MAEIAPMTDGIGRRQILNGARKGCVREDERESAPMKSREGPAIARHAGQRKEASS